MLPGPYYTSGLSMNIVSIVSSVITMVNRQSHSWAIRMKGSLGGYSGPRDN